MNRIVIFGSGSSSLNFPVDLIKDCIVIGVNNTELQYKLDYWFTLDPLIEDNAVIRLKPNNGLTVVAYEYPLNNVDIMLKRIADRSSNGIQGHTGTLAGHRGLSKGELPHP